MRWLIAAVVILIHTQVIAHTGESPEAASIVLIGNGDLLGPELSIANKFEQELSQLITQPVKVRGFLAERLNAEDGQEFIRFLGQVNPRYVIYFPSSEQDLFVPRFKPQESLNTSITDLLARFTSWVMDLKGQQVLDWRQAIGEQVGAIGLSQSVLFSFDRPAQLLEPFLRDMRVLNKISEKQGAQFVLFWPNLWIGDDSWAMESHACCKALAILDFLKYKVKLRARDLLVPVYNEKFTVVSNNRLPMLRWAAANSEKTLFDGKGDVWSQYYDQIAKQMALSSLAALF